MAKKKAKPAKKAVNKAKAQPHKKAKASVKRDTMKKPAKMVAGKKKKPSMMKLFAKERKKPPAKPAKAEETKPAASAMPTAYAEKEEAKAQVAPPAAVEEAPAPEAAPEEEPAPEEEEAPEEKPAREKKPSKEEIKRMFAAQMKKAGAAKVSYLSTGVKDLSSALDGGYPMPGAVLVEGPPGAGKTPLGIAFAAAGLAAGHKCIYICTNNFPDEIMEIASKIGYDLDGIMFIDCYSWLIGEEGKGYGISALNLSGILEKMEDVLKRGEAEEIIFDSLSTLFLYHDDRSVQKFVQAFVAMVKNRDACAMITVEKGTCGAEMEVMLEYLTDGKLLLENETINIERMVGIKPSTRRLRFDVTKKGIEIK